MQQQHYKTRLSSKQSSTTTTSNRNQKQWHKQQHVASSTVRLRYEKLTTSGYMLEARATSMQRQ